MDDTMEDVAKKGHKGLLLLAEFSQQAAVIGQIGNLYTEQYFHKGEYRETSETGRAVFPQRRI
jgi:hypothetical protein